MKIGDWDVGPDGLMSTCGHWEFPVYNLDGSLSSNTVRYFYRDGEIQAHVSHPQEQAITSTSIDTIAIEELERLYQL